MAEIRSITLGWGRAPRRVRLPAPVAVLRPPDPPAARSWEAVIREALSRPIGSPSLSELIRPPSRVCVVVPDGSRKDLARAALPHLLAALRAPGVQITVGTACGKHPPRVVEGADWAHDARDPGLIHVGTTAAGTEVRFPRAVLAADLRVTLGEIRPHYFAGYAGGAKMLFPGVAGEAGIWHNHRMKAAPGARLGVVDGNPCRADMEAAAALAGPTFSINVIRRPDGRPVVAFAGELVAAHRAGVQAARPLFEVAAPPPASVVVVSDRAPVTDSLYQACKLLAPAGRVLCPGGAIVLAAECGDGLGPVETINEAIYALGFQPTLPPGHRVALVSSQPASAVAATFARHFGSVAEAVRALRPSPDAPVIVLPYAGELIPTVATAQVRPGER